MKKTKIVKETERNGSELPEILLLRGPVILLHYKIEFQDGYWNLFTESMSHEQFCGFMHDETYNTSHDCFPLDVLRSFVIDTQFSKWSSQKFGGSKCPYSQDEYFEHFATYDRVVVSSFLNKEALEISKEIRHLISLHKNVSGILKNINIALSSVFTYLKSCLK